LTSRILAFSTPSLPHRAVRHVRGRLYLVSGPVTFVVLRSIREEKPTHKVMAPLATEIMTEYQEIFALIGVILRKLSVSQLFRKCHSFHFHRNMIRHSSQEHVKTCFFTEVSFPFAHLRIAVLNVQVGM